MLVFVFLLTVCSPDSPEKAGVFFIESEVFEFPETADKQPKKFRGSVKAIEGQINGLRNLGVIGSISAGKLRLVLPAHIEDEYLEPVPGGGELKRGRLGFVSGAILLLSRDAEFHAELFYYNRDTPEIKKGWNFRYREPDKPSIYRHTSNIETLYASGEGYGWLVKIVPGME